MSPLTSLVMRSENWATVSPSSARIGSPNATYTGGRPRLGQFWPYGMASDCANDRNGQARHIPADAERRSAWLERAHLPSPRASALGKEQQRYAVVKQAGG